jgi:hypothetical protein
MVGRALVIERPGVDAVEAFVQFEEEDTQAVLVLGLHRDGALPIEP